MHLLKPLSALIIGITWKTKTHKHGEHKPVEIEEEASVHDDDAGDGIHKICEIQENVTLLVPYTTNEILHLNNDLHNNFH